MSLDDRIAQAKRIQLKGEQMDLLEQEGLGNMEEQAPTEYAKSTRLIVDKMHDPKSMHDKQIHTNIPKQILTNVLMMTAIEHGLRKLTDGEQVVIHSDRKKVTILKSDPLTGDMVPYRTISMNAFTRAQFYADAMSGFSGNLLEEMMSAEGWRSDQAVQEVSSLTNSERMLIEAQNQANSGFFRKLWRKSFGK